MVDLLVCTGNVNKASMRRGTFVRYRTTLRSARAICALTPSWLGREVPARVTAVARLRDPDLQHDPARLPQVAQHVHTMVESEVRADCASFRLKHDRRIGRGDHSQQSQPFVGQGAAGRIVPELEAPTMDFGEAAAPPPLLLPCALIPDTPRYGGVRRAASSPERYLA
jgi:hypothetical protein